MASPSGNSSGSAQVVNSGSEVELQLLMDQRKRKRKESNRESAKRSRMKKQQHLDDLTAQVASLRKENHQILTNMQLTTHKYLNVEAENSVLRAQIIELSDRLQSLDDILTYMNNSNNKGGMFESEDDCLLNNPWNLMYFHQPIMASADLFQY